MDQEFILTKEEYEIFQLFSIKMAPSTKKDYLSKIISFKEFLKIENLLEVTKNECRDFIEYIEDEYAKSTCEKIFSYLHSFYSIYEKRKIY